MNLADKHPLATQVQYVKGVGPALAAKLTKLGILTVGDLLHLVPLRYVDRRNILTIDKLAVGKDRTVKGRVVAARISFLGRRRKRIYEVVLEDESKMKVSGKWFYFKQAYMEQKFPLGSEVLFAGDVSRYGNALQFIHPEVEVASGENGFAEITGKILPVYPLTEGVYQKTLRKIIYNAWGKFSQHINSAFPKYLIEQCKLVDPLACLHELHFPSPQADVELLNSGRSLAHHSLIFDEFFFLELGMALRKRDTQLEPGLSFKQDYALHQRFLDAMPFTLTNAQVRVLAEIQKDMEKSQPMNRIVQGDVGSGKTVVAIAAALQAIAAGYQVALMAPTEILAEQHYATVKKMLAAMDLPHELLTGSTKAAARKEILGRLKSGELPFLVGTHALIQTGVDFAKLGLIIVDEQHRFGVLQRAALKQKAENPDILIMTATPIPRTLSMTLYGDLDISVIDEMPKGRKAIVTKLYSENNRGKLYQGIRHELKLGRQAYVIYPLVEESENLDLKNATDSAKLLEEEFSPEYTIGLLHGRMKSAEKDALMQQFKAGKIHVLVATTVVEVGVDVPNASVMVIEHAERFGLSQLHQLRGRVGRGEYQSYCIMMADYKRSQEAKQRLQVMVETNDGFRIAEEDLAIRGPGEFIGTRQSGIPAFRVANLGRDVAVLSQARDVAFELVEQDPELAKPEHHKLKEALLTRWAGKLDLAKIS